MRKIKINSIYIFTILNDKFSFIIKGKKWEISTEIFKFEMILSFIHILKS
jgi:hypothetical protein